MEEQLKVKKVEKVEDLVAMVGWAIIKQDEEELEQKTKSGLFIPKSVALDDVNIKSRLNSEEKHPFCGIVVATGIDNVNIGDKVLINKVCHDNNSVHIKFAGEVLKPIRLGDILGLVRKENLYE